MTGTPDLTLGIDRVSIGIDVDTEEEAEGILTWLQEDKKLSEEVSAPWNHRGYRCLRSIQGKMNGDEFSTPIEIACDPYRSSKAFLKLEWNHTSCDSRVISHILSKLKRILIDPIGILTRARILRIEIYIDIATVLLDNLRVYVKQKQATGLYSDRFGRVETIYPGSKNSKWGVTVYNRRQCLLSKRKSVPPHDVTRVEVIGRGTGLKYHELFSIRNPFDKVSIGEIGSDTSSNDIHFLNFLDACRLRGPLSAMRRLKSMEPKTEKLYRHRLRQSAHWWVQNESLWQQWPTLLAELLPINTYPVCLIADSTHPVGRVVQRVGAEEQVRVTGWTARVRDTRTPDLKPVDRRIKDAHKRLVMAHELNIHAATGTIVLLNPEANRHPMTQHVLQRLGEWDAPCRRVRIPYSSRNVTTVANWIRRERIAALNVVSSDEGVSARTIQAFLLAVLQKCRNTPRRRNRN
ncbi:MAG: hypothetical protein HQL50_01445 [Magnetococcales bacterium]|nr:hypothetical protein [Magnetococcales bacterium]